MTVGRFQVMSLLQAARAHSLGLPLESAYSWGLNRAIFIAAAKKGFKTGSDSASGDRAKEGRTYLLGDDMAYKAEKKGALLFTIGGKVQTKEEFDKRVISRFGGRFPQAWKEALEYVSRFDKKTLLSSEAFFHEVYRPERDRLAEKWSAMGDQA